MNPLTGHTIGEFSKSLSVSTPHLLSMRGKCLGVSNCFNLQLCRNWDDWSPVIKYNFCSNIFPFQNHDWSTNTASCGKKIVRPKCSVRIVIAKIVPFITSACEHESFCENVNIDDDLCCQYCSFPSKFYPAFEAIRSPFLLLNTIFQAPMISSTVCVIFLWPFRKLFKEVVSSVDVEIENKNCPWMFVISTIKQFH